MTQISVGLSFYWLNCEMLFRYLLLMYFLTKSETISKLSNTTCSHCGNQIAINWDKILIIFHCINTVKHCMNKKL
ncbi:hypothetical protein RJT34_19278 [Clitoria ternatea]|uniref:Uncharacterized protein n=1 Tax=Clitoria ternatea TaxID=43366 RepID=A0AAN9IQZ2_CLITE